MAPDTIMAVAFFTALAIVATSIAKVWMRRIDARREAPPDRALAQQMARIEAAVEAISIEVERISEAQRFSARLAAEGERARLMPPGRASEGRINTPH